MVHIFERQRLIRTLSHEPIHAFWTVSKCGTCLALLTLLMAVGGANADGGIAREMRRVVPDAASVVARSGVAAHRKEVFDGRRAHFMGNAPEPDIAVPALATHAEAGSH